VGVMGWRCGGCDMTWCAAMRCDDVDDGGVDADDWTNDLLRIFCNNQFMWQFFSFRFIF